MPMKLRVIKNERTPPDISIAGLSLWVQGRQSPHSNDRSDAGWLLVVASYASGSAEAWVEGPILTREDLQNWVRQLRKLEETLTGAASLEPAKPQLRIDMVAGTLGHLTVTVQFRPGSVGETHEFITDVDQTYLRSLIGQIDQILETYPVF